MPKPGYTRIIVKSEIRDILEKLAEAQEYQSINRLLEAWIRVHPTGIREIRHQKINPETSLFQKRQFKDLVGSPGFEPGSERPKLGA